MLRANRRLSQKRQAILTHRGCLHWKRQEHGWYGSHPMSDRQKRKRKSDCLCKQTVSQTRKKLHSFLGGNGSHDMGHGTLQHISQGQTLHSIFRPQAP